MKTIISILLILISFNCFGEEYNREKHFGGWIDADHNGVNTREEVLIEESLFPVLFNQGKVDWGLYYCSYTGEIVLNPKKLDIDHMVPLKEAWLSGADKWSNKKRIEYANYLKDKNHLIAVTAGSNRSKGAKDIGEWLPNKNKKGYISKWISVKEYWDLCFDNKEIEVIKNYNFAIPENRCIGE